MEETKEKGLAEFDDRISVAATEALASKTTTRNNRKNERNPPSTRKHKKMKKHEKEGYKMVL